MDVLDSIHRVTLFELNHDYKVISYDQRENRSNCRLPKKGLASYIGGRHNKEKVRSKTKKA